MRFGVFSDRLCRNFASRGGFDFNYGRLALFIGTSCRLGSRRNLVHLEKRLVDRQYMAAKHTIIADFAVKIHSSAHALRAVYVFVFGVKQFFSSSQIQAVKKQVTSFFIGNMQIE